MRLRPYRRSLVLIGLACLLVLLVTGTRLFASRGPDTGGATLAVPVWPGRTVTLNVWLRDNVSTFWPDAPGFAKRGSITTVRNPGSVMLALWFHDRVAGSTTRLAMIKIPPWPLLLLAAGLAAGGYVMRPGRSTGRLF